MKEKTEEKKQEKIWEVGEFIDYLNVFLKKEKVTLVGEISEINKHPTGIYFLLKDRNENGLLQCYLRPWRWKLIESELVEGLVVKVKGIAYVYKPKSVFSFEVEEVEPYGEGSLRKAYEILKEKLEKEGLFSRKRQLPKVISNIGLITSSQGAAIGDFLHNLRKVGLKIYFYDVRVEGEKAALDIIKAVDYFNTKLKGNIDVLVIIRGGGSLEDLKAFNNEAVVRKIFTSQVPVICGVGHERDISLASLTSDVSVSTPSFAAQVINSLWDNLNQEVSFLEGKIIASFEKMFLNLPLLQKSVIYSFKNVLDKQELKLANLKERLLNLIDSVLETTYNKIKGGNQYLEAVNPLKILKLGYSVVFNENGKVIKNVAVLREGEKIKTKFYRGVAQSKVEKIFNDKEEKYEGKQEKSNI